MPRWGGPTSPPASRSGSSSRGCTSPSGIFDQVAWWARRLRAPCCCGSFAHLSCCRPCCKRHRDVHMLLDLGDRRQRFCVVGCNGEVVEEGSLVNERAQLSALVGRYPAALVVMEAGCHSAWVSRYLEQLGCNEPQTSLQRSSHSLPLSKVTVR